METTENNKLIAEFMGMNYGDPNDNSVMTQMTPQGNEVVRIDSMKYHTSWDWLMPVVQRIECTSTDNKDNSDNFFNVTIEVFECNINGVDTSINISHNAQTKIKTTYNAVVEFIKEYNKQN